MENMRLEPGTILAEKYRLENVLGVGGMGTVYRAEHLALKAPVAIKIIDREVTDGDLTMARFMREAQAAASLRSPHVVQILDYGTEGDRPFMVMEMLEGEPLSDRIERYGHLTPSETFRVINHVAKAVARAHEADIVHRDLKPDNVFLVHNEGDEIAKVLDFGVAKIEATQLDGSGHTRTGSLLGTPYYMSPEQAQGNKHIDARSDLWALGVIAFECLLGRRPRPRGSSPATAWATWCSRSASETSLCPVRLGTCPKALTPGSSGRARASPMTGFRPPGSWPRPCTKLWAWPKPTHTRSHVGLEGFPSRSATG